MARKESNQSKGAPISATVDDLLAAALERGDEGLETGRYIVTFKEHTLDEGIGSLKAQGLRIADTRDFEGQALTLENLGDADSVVFPEIGCAIVGGAAFESRGMSLQAEIPADSPIETIEPEYFVFSQAETDRYLRGFVRAAEAIAQDLGLARETDVEPEEDPQVVGATWGLIACKVPPSVRSGAGIKVAVLDTGMDLGHPDFAGRTFVTQTFVGQPVQDLYGHGTHMIGTACGPKSPAGTTPRYGIGYRTAIHVAKVLSNSGSGSTAGVLSGMNWAIAQRCPAILVALGSQAPVQAAYTAAGTAALNKGCVMIAPAGVTGSSTAAPANSPTIMAVAALDQTLKPAAFSNFGKIDIAAPGRDIFSSILRPQRYATWSGTSSAAAHVAGCAALWAQTSPALRGTALWKKLQATAKPLPFPPSKVGAGLVQAP